MSGTRSPRTRLGVAQGTPLRRSKPARRVAALTARLSVRVAHKVVIVRLPACTLFDCDIPCRIPAYPGARTRQPSYTRSLAALTTGTSVGEAWRRSQTRPGQASPGVGVMQKRTRFYAPAPLRRISFATRNTGRGRRCDGPEVAAFELLLLLAARSLKDLACARGSCRSLETDRHPALACHEPERNGRHNTADVDRSPAVGVSSKTRLLLDD